MKIKNILKVVFRNNVYIFFLIGISFLYVLLKRVFGIVWLLLGVKFCMFNLVLCLLFFSCCCFLNSVVVRF